MDETKHFNQNPHHPSNKSSSPCKKCWWILISLLALFCLLCVYKDLKGQPSDPIEVIKSLRNSLQWGKIYNKSKAIGSEVADEMADSPSFQHFHQYTFTSIWETYKNKVIDFFTSIFQGEQRPSEPPKWQTTTEERTVINTPEGMKTVIIKEIKSCTLEGEEEKCVRTKSEQVIQPNPRPKISDSKKEEAENKVQEKVVPEQKVEEKEQEKKDVEIKPEVSEKEEKEL